MDVAAYLRNAGFADEFPIDPSTLNEGQKRREQVIPMEHPVRGWPGTGVYVFLKGNRCLYAGCAAANNLVGRALDYLWKEGSRPDVYRGVREHADRLFLKSEKTAGAARRLELRCIVDLEPVLNEGFIYATDQERLDFGLPPEPDKCPGA